MFAHRNTILFGIIGIISFMTFAGGQFYLMCHHATKMILPGPPLGMDQVVYLFEAYQAALIGQVSGALKGLADLVGDAPAAGFGLQVTAYGVMLIAGISRMSALAVNFFYFAAVPCLLSLIIGRDKPLGLHLFLWGLWLSIRSMYGLIGGPFDFRLDFTGMALFALVCALLWRSEVFTRPVPCVLAGLVAIWLCITRFIMAVHLGMVGVILFGCLLIFPSLRTTRSTWRGVAITLAVAGAGIVPYVVLQWDRLWAYYVVGHVTGPEEQIRAIMQGISNWREALAFYPHALLHEQLGALSGRLIALTIATAVALAMVDRLRARSLGPHTTGSVRPSRSAVWAVLVVGAAGLGPYITLNADTLKSGVAANVFLVPAGGIGLLASFVIANMLPRLIGARRSEWTTLGLGVLVLATGLTYEFKALARPTVVTEHQSDFAARDRMLTLITETSIANDWRAPLLFVDHVGQLDGLQMELSHFERYGTDLQILRLLAQIEEVPPEQLWPSLLKADFLILRDPSAKDVGSYPYDVQMARLNPQLQAFCRERCQELGSFIYFRTPMSLYARAPGPVPASWSPGAIAPLAYIPIAASPASTAVPPGLSRDPFDAKGVFPDGWVDRLASFTFHLAAPERKMLSITGELPGTPSHGLPTELVRLSVNGSTVAEQKIAAGDFTIHVKLSPVAGDVNLTIAGDGRFPLALPDTRTVSLLIRSIQWDSETGVSQ
jgi:hypothetical protein